MGTQLSGRVIAAFFAMLSVVALGTFGYWVLGRGAWPLSDCLYMTVITLTTVGYAELLPGFPEVEYARSFTIVLIVLGMGVILYFVSSLTAFIIEGDLRRALKTTRMRKKITNLSDHIIVCGIGSTGRHVVTELVSTGTPMVAIDSDAERLQALIKELGEDAFPYVVGDGTDDDVLESAGLSRARCLVAALATDKDNLYLVVSARQSDNVRPDLRIVARAIEPNVGKKLTMAGADSVVSPNAIGGLRLASEALRPAVVEFLDKMLHGEEATRIAEVSLPADASLLGHSLRQLDLRRRANVTVLAIKQPGDQRYIYNPDADFVLSADMTLVVLGTSEDVNALRQLVA